MRTPEVQAKRWPHLILELRTTQSLPGGQTSRKQSTNVKEPVSDPATRLQESSRGPVRAARPRLRGAGERASTGVGPRAPARPAGAVSGEPPQSWRRETPTSTGVRAQHAHAPMHVHARSHTRSRTLPGPVHAHALPQRLEAAHCGGPASWGTPGSRGKGGRGARHSSLGARDVVSGTVSFLTPGR